MQQFTGITNRKSASSAQACGVAHSALASGSKARTEHTRMSGDRDEHETRCSALSLPDFSNAQGRIVTTSANSRACILQRHWCLQYFF